MVPRERIITVCRLGFTMMAGAEVVVLGGETDEAWVASWANPSERAAAWTESEYKRQVRQYAAGHAG